MKKILVMSFFLVLTLLQQAIAQDRTVSGRVVDKQTGQGIPGVTVLVKGTTIGTATNIEGDYTLNVPADGTTLQFSFIGYTTQEQPIGAGPVNVNLAVDAKQLSEVVVTALGIEREERALGYSATTVGNEEITKGRSSSAMNSLQGKVAGVNISSASGAPGASSKVILRGYSSIGGNNNPLYVVDGVPVNNDAGNFNEGSNSVNRTQDFGNRANDINPDDIESITILKGASATALYGSRAANGVILITTKKGKSGEKVAIDYTTSATFSRPLRLPQLQNSFGQGWNGSHYLNENGSWGPRFDGRDRLWGHVVDNSQQLKPFTAQEDNLKDFFETGTSFINTIGISGGTEKSTFYLSYGNVQEDGIIPSDADSYNRNTLSLRGSTKGNKLTASSSLNYVRKDAQVVMTGQGGEGTTVFQEITQIPRDISIVDHRDISNKFNNLDNYFTIYAQNPYYPLETNGNDFEENRLFGNFNLDYKLTDWLSATSRIGGDLANGVISDWIAIGIPTPGSPRGGVTPIPGRVNERTRFARELNGDFLLSANNNFSEDLTLNSLVGYNVNERYSRSAYQYISGLDIPNYYNLSNSSNPARASTLTSLRRLYGVYGQAEVNFRDFLFLTVLARNDWSSTLPADNNSFFYPGVNASFVFTDVVPGIQGILNYGKVRAAWGKTGNDADPYSIQSVMVPGTVQLPFGEISYPLNGINSFEVSNQIGNPNLTPEITSEYEFGTNLQFFDNRFGIDAAYYNKKTDGQILKVPIATSTGYTIQVMNIGEVQNKGIELGITAAPIKTNDFNWDIRYTFTRNRNEVLSLTSGLERVLLTGSYDVDFVAVVGQPLGVYQGPGYLRDPEGRVVVNAATGFPIQTAEKETYGNAQADYMMGLFNTFTYKNLSLSVGFDYRKGGLMYSYTQRLAQFVGNTTNSLYNDRQPFVVPNSVVNTGTIENPVYVENTKIVDNANIANYWNDSNNGPIEREHVIERDYLKLREVALNYSLPENIYGKTPFKGISVGIVGRNLWMWTPENNNIVDPESTTFGNDLQGEFGEFAGLPTVRTIGASLKVTL